MSGDRFKEGLEHCNTEIFARQSNYIVESICRLPVVVHEFGKHGRLWVGVNIVRRFASVKVDDEWDFYKQKPVYL